MGYKLKVKGVIEMNMVCQRSPHPTRDTVEGDLNTLAFREP